MSNRLIVIPARLQSKRLPNKPLLKHNGKTLLQRVWENAVQVPDTDVLVTSPDSLILKKAAGWGASIEPTAENCIHGTQRCILAAKKRYGSQLPETVINLQCDEPDVTPEQIHRLFRLAELQTDTVVTMTGLLPKNRVLDPNCVKAWVVAGRCLWFTRAATSQAEGHIGIYAIRNRLVHLLDILPNCPAATVAGLEQLNWIVAGVNIFRMQLTGEVPISINTSTDWDTYCQCHA